MRDELERIARTSVLRDKCTFTGLISSTAVADILRRSTVFLLPTRIEGFGFVIAEAMMCGAVPVVSNLAGITDTIVAHNESGVLVEEDDVEGFSSAIIGLFSNPDRLSSMMHAAQKAAQEKFSLQRMIDDYERLFAEEDDRPTLPKRGIAWWSLEVLREMVRKNPDGTYRFQKKLGTFKSVLMSSAGRIEDQSEHR
jgi:glycosyltransferase involved in cell wall biosynthesis